MWTFLSEPEKSYAVKRLAAQYWDIDVQQNLKDCFVLAFIEKEQFLALAMLVPVSSRSGYLSFWASVEGRKYANLVYICRSLHKFIFGDLKMLTVIALSRKRNVQSLCKKFSATRTLKISHYFGLNQPAFVAIWEQKP